MFQKFDSEIERHTANPYRNKVYTYTGFRHGIMKQTLLK